MKRTIHRFILLSLILSPSISVWADHAEEIKKLKEEEELLKAKVARDNAEAEAINASTALATAKANAIKNNDTIETSALNSEAAKIKAQVEKDFAKVSGLKSALGEPPDVGNRGTVTFEDGKNSPVFMPVQRGSLKLTWDYAQKVCSVLDEKVSPVYVISSDFDAKYFSAKDKLNRFASVYKEADKIANETGLKSQAQAKVAPALFAAAMSAQYIAGAIQTLANLFKVDTSIKLGDNKDRNQSLKYFMSGICPGKIVNVDITDVTKYKSETDAFLEEMKFLDQFFATLDDVKLKLTSSISSLEQQLAKLSKKDGTRKGLEDRLARSKSDLKLINDREPTVVRLKAFVDQIRANPGEWISAIALDKLGSEVLKGNRLNIDYATQDAQFSKTNWFLGTRVYGTSYGEMTYRIINNEGKVLFVGYLIGENSVGKLDLTSHQPNSNITGKSQSTQ